MNALLELGSLLALLGIPLVCSTWLADAVLLPKQALFTVAATLLGATWLAGWACGRWPLWRGRWSWLAGAPWLWTLPGTLAAGWPTEGESEAALGIGLALTGLAWSATLTPQRERRWLNLVILAAALLAGYSWIQRLGLDPVAWSLPHLSRERTIATLGNPDFLALYLVVAAPLALERLLECSRPVRWVGLLGWVLACQALILTTTRGAWLAGVAAAALWLWQARRRPEVLRLSLGLALALALLLAVTGWWQSGRSTDFTVARRVQSLANLRENSFTTRLFLWHSAWQLGNRKPLLGQGWGTFPYLALEFRALEPVELRILQRLPEDPHNQYCQWLATGGYPALGLWLAGLAWYLRRAPTPGRAAAGLALAVNLLFLCCTLETAVVWMLLFATLQAPEEVRVVGSPRERLAVPLVLLITAGAAWWAGRAIVVERALWWGDEHLLRAQGWRSGWEQSVAAADECYARALELAGPGQNVVALERRGRLRLQILHGVGFNAQLATEGLEFYRAASRLAPLNPYPWAAQARILGLWSPPNLARGQLAEQAWQEALDRDPRNPQFWAEWGLLAARAGQFPRALERLDQALAIFPDSLEFLLYKAQVLQDLGRASEAEALRAQVRLRDPSRRAPEHGSPESPGGQ